MEFNKLPLAVVWIVDDVDHAAPFHAPNDIPGLLTRHSEPWRYILYLQSVSGFSEEEGLNVVLVLFCGDGCPLSEGRGGLLLALEVFDLSAHFGVAVQAVVE